MIRRVWNDCFESCRRTYLSREVVQLKVALQAIEPIKNACLNADNESLRKIGEQLNLCASIRDKIAKEINNDPPLLVNKEE